MIIKINFLTIEINFSSFYEKNQLIFLNKIGFGCIYGTYVQFEEDLTRGFSLQVPTMQQNHGERSLNID